MPEVAATRSPLAAFAGSHPGLQRENNEDRCHADAERGIFFVIDGVGGQAAGDKAAEIAQTLLVARLERETGAVTERIREAITVANNEIHRAAASDPRWQGMACVLTVAIVQDGRAVVGHVGDSRLYKLRAGAIRKITRDHSPVGEREDRGEISESEAMRHPRRNEIYRDVGSEPHSPTDEGFIDIVEIPFEPDSALLLCTDGLTDLVSSGQIAHVVSERAGDPARVVEGLLEAANRAGGKDNVSAVFVEGERFAGSTSGIGQVRSMLGPLRAALDSRWFTLALGCALGVALVVASLAWTRQAPLRLRDLLPAPSWPRTWVVSQDGPGDFTSIQAALAGARAGDIVRVEPGEYREHLVLTGAVTFVSAVPRGAVIVPPTESGANGAAVELQGGSCRLSGFRIVGDKDRALGVGVRLRRSDGELDGVEISGARLAAVEIEGASHPTVRASYIHDNPGLAVIVGPLANPMLAHNVISDNGRQGEMKPALEVHDSARPVLFGNIVVNNALDVVRGLNASLVTQVARDNIIGRPVPPAAAQKPATPRRK